MANDPQENNPDFVAYSGSKPVPSTDALNPSYTSYDGRKIYLQFDDADSTGLSPATGTHLRFSITKINSGSATTVIPTSTAIETNAPKTLILNISSADKTIDALYDAAGIVTSYQTVFVSYDSSSFGTTVPKLGDNDSTRSLVDTFAGFAVSNRTNEANPPVFLYANTSYDGLSVTATFREATPPLLPYTGISGFAISQSGIGLSVLTAYVKDPTSATDGKKVVIALSDRIAINDSTNPVTISYTPPTSGGYLKLSDSTSLRNTVSGFAGSAVTNLTEEIIAPTIISAYSNTGSIGNTVYLKMSERTLPTSPSGFTIKLNDVSKTFAATAGTTTYLSNVVTEYNFGLIGSTFNSEDQITINYSKPTSNFVYDLSNNANPLASLIDPLNVTNLVTDSVAPTLVTSLSYVDQDGLNIYLKFTENASLPLLPSTGITGFRVSVNGAFSPLKNAIYINDSTKSNIVKITLYSKIHKNDIVKISYVPDNPTTAYSLRDSSSNYVTLFEPTSITNYTLDNPLGFYDPLEWNSEITSSLNNGGNSGSGGISIVGSGDDFFIDFTEIFTKEERYPQASVILDTHPPYGTVILNRKATDADAGIKVHQFAAYGNSSDSSLTQSDYELSHLLQGWQYISSSDQTLSEVSFKLKKFGTIANSGDKIEFLVYSNELPGELVGKIGEIIYGDLTDSYQTFTFNPTSSIQLLGSNTYWFIISLSSLPISTSGTAKAYTAQIDLTDGVIAYYDYDLAKWIKTLDKSGYIKLLGSNILGDPLSSRDILLDILETPIREVNTFGGGTDESQFEVIGDDQFTYILKKINKITDASGNSVYPEVINIVVGATSSLPKNYSLEVKELPTSEWISILDTISDEDTYEFLNYTFDTPKQLSQIRLSYRGDYFTIDQTAELTIAAKDDLSDIVSAQVSHFPDFRDVNNFDNTNIRGFFDFREGVTEYSNFPISNPESIWVGQSTYGTSEITASIKFGTKIIVACNNVIYFYSDNAVKTITSSLSLSSTIQITCFAIYKNKVYAGTTNGLIYSSYNGEFWTLVNPLNPLDRSLPNYIKPIKTLTAWGKYLYIGTSKGSSNYSSIYTYNGKSISKLIDFEFEEITSSASFANLVFVGMGDGPGSLNSAIYKYNGLEWTKTLSSDASSVDALCYSGTKKSLLAGFSGGQVWELPFDSNNDPTSWSINYDTFANRIYSISDDSADMFTFISTDNGLFSYIKSEKQYKSITSFKTTTPKLSLRVRNYPEYALAFSTNTDDIESFNKQYFSTITDINYNNFITGAIPADITIPNYEIEGFIKAESSTTYAFRLITDLPVKVYMNDELVMDYFTVITSEQTYNATQTFTVTEGDYIKFKIFGSYSTSTTRSLKLYWNDINGTDGYVIVPSTQFIRSNRVKGVWNNLSTFAGAGSDGNVYLFDPSFYQTKIRRVYVRLKDVAGNIHGIVLPGKTAAYPVLSDKINQDLKTSNGSKVSSGKIFQINKNSNYVLSTKAVYTPKLSNYSVYAPDRKVRGIGYWESQPFYVPSLSQWGNLNALILNKYGLNDLEGLDAGTEIKIYVKSSTSRDNVLAASYSEAFKLSYINNQNVPVTAETFTVPLQTFGGKWLQYKIELISATKNLTPEVLSVTVDYTAATGSYFFTKMFDSANYSSETIAPKFRRGLLTSNQIENNGTITYGFTTDNSDGATFDFSKYTEITPNQTFELTSPSSNIRFAIMFTSVGATPSIVYDFGVQLDAGSADMNMMPGL